MNTLTKNELNIIESILKTQSFLIENNKTNALLCDDINVRVKFEKIAAQHQKHFDIILYHLKRGFKNE